MRSSGWLRAVVAATLAVALAGCGLVSPVVPDDTAAPLPTIEIGSDGTDTSELVAALYVAALQAADDPAEVVAVTPGTEALAVADNSPMAMPVFAATLLQDYSNDPLPTDATTTITNLATAVAPQLGVLRTSSVDGRLVWASDSDSGLSSLTDLAALPASTVVAVPGFGMENAAGLPALQVAYGATLAVKQIDGPSERAAALADGTAAAALFRSTESIELDGLTILEDPIGTATPDPLVVLLSSEFADQRPDAVLVLDAVQKALTDASLAELAASATVDGLDPAIATWLAAHGLAG